MTSADLSLRQISGWLLALSITLSLLAACGGVGEEGTDVQASMGDQTVNVGVLKSIDRASITVNDITYRHEQALVTNGFGDVVGQKALRLGMWLEVESAGFNEGGPTKATSIRIRPSARGKVTKVNMDKLSVELLSATASYSSDVTVLAGVDDIGALSDGDLVEVHGPLGADDGTVEASRLAKLPQQKANKPFELRGRVRRLNRTNSTMIVGRQPVRFADASIMLRRALNNGQVVRVSAAKEPAPNQAWTVDRLIADQTLPLNLGFAYAEGVVTNLEAGPLFMLEGLKVDATTANNRGRVETNGQRVALIGAIRDGVLKAKSVAVIRRGRPAVFVLGGAITRFESPAKFRVRGVLIDASKARFVDGSATDLANRARVRVIGRMVGRRLIATRAVLLD